MAVNMMQYTYIRRSFFSLTLLLWSAPAQHILKRRNGKEEESESSKLASSIFTTYDRVLARGTYY
jgi:hypothetical protein